MAGHFPFAHQRLRVRPGSPTSGKKMSYLEPRGHRSAATWRSPEYTSNMLLNGPNDVMRVGYKADNIPIPLARAALCSRAACSARSWQIFCDASTPAGGADKDQPWGRCRSHQWPACPAAGHSPSMVGPQGRRGAGQAQSRPNPARARAAHGRDSPARHLRAVVYLDLRIGHPPAGRQLADRQVQVAAHQPGRGPGRVRGNGAAQPQAAQRRASSSSSAGLLLERVRANPGHAPGAARPRQLEPDERGRGLLPGAVRRPNPAVMVEAWSMRHLELAVICWSAALTAVFAPAAVTLYRRKALR
jgi:hypothetical protein